MYNSLKRGMEGWITVIPKRQGEACVRLFETPTDCSPPGSFVHGILQTRILEWVAISFSRGSF